MITTMAEFKTRRRNLMRTESCDVPIVTKPSQIREKKIERHESQYQQQSTHQRRNNEYNNYNSNNNSITDNSDILSVHSTATNASLTFVRPVTAISLPTKVQAEQEAYNFESQNLSSGAGAKLKNPSCPSIQQNANLNYSYSIDNDDDSYENGIGDDTSYASNSSGHYRTSKPKRSTHPNKQTNYQRRNQQHTVEYGREDYSKFSEITRRYLTNESQHLPITTITAATETTNSNATINSQNSKIDTLLGLTPTLFTTKFECIGPNKTGSDTSIKNIPDSSHISIRSKSVSNLNEKAANSQILSQNQIKTVITNKHNLSNNSSNSSTANDVNTDARYQRDAKNQSLLSINTITLRNKGNNSGEAVPPQPQIHYKNSGFNLPDDSKRNSSINNYYPNYYQNNGGSKTGAGDSKGSTASQNFINITENIFIGNLSVIKNERKMCRLNVEYLIDMTNMRPDDLNRQTLGKLPCLCKQQHSRLYLTVELVDTSYKNLFNSFAEVNKFIEKARKANKKVLIFSREIFQQHLICACAQYLMLDYEMNLENALNTISKRLQTSTLYIEKCFLDYLKNFESYLSHLSINLYGTNDNKVRSTIINDDNVVHNNSSSSSSSRQNSQTSGSNARLLNNTKQQQHQQQQQQHRGSRLIEQTEKKRYSGHHHDNDEDDDDEDDDDDEEDDYDEDEDEDDGRSVRRSKVQNQKFTVLPVSGASDIESRRNNQSNNNLKMAWI